MRNLDEIRIEIEQLTEQRAALLHELGSPSSPPGTSSSRSGSRSSGTSIAWLARSSAGAIGTGSSAEPAPKSGSSGRPDEPVPSLRRRYPDTELPLH